MSTTLQKIRSIIQDQPLYQSDTITSNGTDTVVQVTFFPVVGESVIITPDTVPILFTVDEQNGVITFDTAPAEGAYVVTYMHVLLLDSTIQDFLDIEDTAVSGTADIRLAAADALDAIASSQALIQKKIKLLDLSTDGPALAKALRDHAATLRKQVLDPDMQESAFDYVEMVNDIPGWEEKVFKDFMREN